MDHDSVSSRHTKSKNPIRFPESQAVPEQQVDGFTRVDKIRPDSKAQDCLL
jgi:hypothetical protein